ncbi:unnamed protein product [Dovyalis caffra]|uniref:Uncharacterized protein n=1 Tax=Dovyalis caffra TaxID=77055 RepID=A0AAV1RLN0_9ROSI|nr:unnamed protein product [Dovyalis caffra]
MHNFEFDEIYVGIIGLRSSTIQLGLAIDLLSRVPLLCVSKLMRLRYVLAGDLACVLTILGLLDIVLTSLLGKDENMHLCKIVARDSGRQSLQKDRWTMDCKKVISDLCD